MNKKILAILMAMLMIAMSAVAFAAVEDAKNDSTQLNQGLELGKDAGKIKIVKVYTGTGRPAETFNFKVYTDEAGKNPATGFTEVNITLGDDEKITSDTAYLDLPAVDAEAYANKPGENIFYIKETKGNYAGVTYSPDTYKLTVTVYTETDTDGNLVYQRVATIRKMSDLRTKHDEASFTNTYDSTSMTVKKVLAGNAANMNDTFEFTVTFKKPLDGTLLKSAISGVANDTENVTVSEPSVNATDGTVTFTLSGMGHNDMVTFSNLPVGTIYSVVETPNNKGYTVEYSDNDKKENEKVVLADEDTNVVVTNTKKVDIDTGVTTDNMPYIMLMAFAMMIAAAVLLKKRTVND